MNTEDILVDASESEDEALPGRGGQGSGECQEPSSSRDLDGLGDLPGLPSARTRGARARASGPSPPPVAEAGEAAEGEVAARGFTYGLFG